MAKLKVKKVLPPAAPTLFEDTTIVTKQVVPDNTKKQENKLDISGLGINADWENFGTYIKSLGNGHSKSN